MEYLFVVYYRIIWTGGDGGPFQKDIPGHLLITAPALTETVLSAALARVAEEEKPSKFYAGTELVLTITNIQSFSPPVEYGLVR